MKTGNDLYQWLLDNKGEDVAKAFKDNTFDLNESKNILDEKDYSLSGILLGAFTWSDSEQGHQFWSDIQAELVNLKNDEI